MEQTDLGSEGERGRRQQPARDRCVSGVVAAMAVIPDRHPVPRVVLEAGEQLPELGAGESGFVRDRAGALFEPLGVDAVVGL